MNKLNIGCGLDIKKGWVNLDSHNKNGADIIFDLNNIPKERLPFDDESFDYIYCSHVLEDFIEPIVIIDEFIRICKIGGKIEIKTPFETNNNLTNIRHKSLFTLSKLNSLAETWGYNSYGGDYKLKVEELYYYADNGSNKTIQLIKKGIANFYNALPYKLIERTFIKYLFCVLNCKVVYERVK